MLLHYMADKLIHIRWQTNQFISNTLKFVTEDFIRRLEKEMSGVVETANQNRSRSTM